MNAVASLALILTVPAVIVPVVTPFLIAFNAITLFLLSTVSVTLIFTVGSLANTAARSFDTASVPSVFAKSPMPPLIP